MEAVLELIDLPVLQLSRLSPTYDQHWQQNYEQFDQFLF